LARQDSRAFAPAGLLVGVLEAVGVLWGDADPAVDDGAAGLAPVVDTDAPTVGVGVPLVAG
jgi:hypothetical protein